ncbi:MAG: DNA pilot protein [Microviridae sp.]|nr:MAG: DNA pilot protein [Microviridae sp.]
MPFPFAAVIPAVAGIAGSLITASQQNANSDATIAQNKELAKYAYDRDREAWERNNSYNSPYMQMQRLKEAGLNPNMIYGSGSSVGNTSGAQPKYNTPNIQVNRRSPLQDIPEILSAYQDYQIRASQNDNLKAQEQLTQERIITERMNNQFLADSFLERYSGLEKINKLRELQGERLSWQNKLAPELMRTQLSAQRADLRYKEQTLEDRMRTPALLNQSLSARNIIDTYKADLSKYNINSSDSILSRMAALLLQSAMPKTNVKTQTFQIPRLNPKLKR